MRILLFLLLCPLLLIAQSNPSIDEKDLQQLVSQHTESAFLVFPAPRDQPIRPRWKLNGKPSAVFKASVQPNEFFTFQLGILAHIRALKEVKPVFSDFINAKGDVIKAAELTCFNTQGTDFQGHSFSKYVSVPSGTIQPLWIGIQFPARASGTYTGKIKISESGTIKKEITIQLTANGAPLADTGVGEGSRLARLQWLNSTVGQDKQVTKGFIPVSRKGTTLSILGREIQLAPNGLPKQINSYFGGSNQLLQTTPRPILSSPIQLVIETAEGKKMKLQPNEKGFHFTTQTPSEIGWEVSGQSTDFQWTCKALVQFDGFMEYKISLKSLKRSTIKDIRLETSFSPEQSEYMMGIGREGGEIPASWNWKWDTTKNQDAVWIGGINGGLRFKLKDDNYRRPLVNIYYDSGKLLLPDSWGNEQKGGIRLAKNESSAGFTAFSGDRILQKGQTLHFDFELLITPFKLINIANQYGDRYFHPHEDVETAEAIVPEAEKLGANIINIHHAKEIYPYINYPYNDDNIKELKAFVNTAHQANKRVKLYYTTRELTVNVPEFWAFNSLNNEVIYPGKGNTATTLIHKNGPDPWLKENLGGKYIPAWVHDIRKGKFAGKRDMSVITTPDSRLNNFYLGGLDWMVKNMQIDGLYIDDSALDRTTLRRARKVLDNNRPEPRIDLHSWNHFNDWAGWASCLNLYMDLLPYTDLVWIGEGRDYNRLPDHWLIEVSGIPFGLTGQMLEGGGNPWRGMVYGITNRAGWHGSAPDPIWKFWDQYQIRNKRMIGYWEKDCPITSSNPAVKVTVYAQEDQLLLALANWTDQEQTVSLSSPSLRLTDYSIETPEIAGLQQAKTIESLDKLSIAGKKGYILVLTKRK